MAVFVIEMVAVLGIYTKYGIAAIGSNGNILFDWRFIM